MLIPLDEVEYPPYKGGTRRDEMTFNGFPITIHEITEEFGKLIAVVNKGEEKTAFTFKVAADRIEGLVVA